LGAAVNIITTDGPAGRHGMAASAVCSVSDSPPTVLACINRASATNAAFKTNGVLCVNILASRHKDLCGRFSTRGLSSGERFADADAWRPMGSGAPALIDAPAVLDCRITEVSEVGSHSVFFCQVLDIRLHDQAECLVYFQRRFIPVV